MLRNNPKRILRKRAQEPKVSRSRESALASNTLKTMTILDTCPAALRPALLREIVKISEMYSISFEKAREVVRTNDEHEAAIKRTLGL